MPGPEPSLLDLELVRALADSDADGWREDAGARLVEQRAEAAVRRAVPGLGDDVSSLLDQAERLVDVVPYPPVDAPRRTVATAKKAVRRATIGPFHHLATQVSSIGATLVAALRILDRRLARVEAADAPSDVLPDAPPLPGPVIAACVELLSGGRGVVVHVEAGTGELVAALAAAGFDAIGLEPRPALVAEARRLGRPVREGGVADLLGGRRTDLGAVVLSGVVDVVSPGRQAELAASAAAALSPAGRLVVLTHDADSWAAAQPVLADLAPGHPLRPATWRHLLAELGLVVGSARTVSSPEGGGSTHIVVASRAAGPPVLGC